MPRHRETSLAENVSNDLRHLAHSLGDPFGSAAHSVIPSRGFVGAGGGLLFRGLALPASVVPAFRLSVRFPCGKKSFVRGIEPSGPRSVLNHLTQTPPGPQGLFQVFRITDYE